MYAIWYFNCTPKKKTKTTSLDYAGTAIEQINRAQMKIKMKWNNIGVYAGGSAVCVYPNEFMLQYLYQTNDLIRILSAEASYKNTHSDSTLIVQAMCRIL